LGEAPPGYMGLGMFNGITAAQTVTVKVPSGATAWADIIGTYSGTDETLNWGNCFRGGGWDGSYFVSYGYINTNITVVVQYYQ
jgi:hypothetical protein